MSERTFYFDGDYVKRVEFVPKENIAEVKARFVSFGVVNIQNGGKEYNFKPFSILLGIKNVSYKYIILSIQNILRSYDKVIISENFPDEDGEKNEMFAFGDENFALWGGRENLVSDKVGWLEFVKLRNAIDSEDVEKKQLLNDLSRAVYLIGVKYNLLLIDLDERKIIDCSNLKDIMEYFHSW